MTKNVKILNAPEERLLQISRENLLALNIEEMKAIKEYFSKRKRNPTDIELETIAQTWSEHCKHKTLAGMIEYTEKNGRGGKTRNYNNLLKETVFKVTKELNKKWCISVFRDNAGIIEFDGKNGIAFKVETHNHPSALEPYGGAGTGIGGVIRDILGVGLGAKPILNTDVFCFGNLDCSFDDLPRGVLHPKRIFKGVVSGVRDYGNRMGIPTANGAVLFDENYVCNPLVYCGTLGIIPRNKCFKKVSPKDVIIAVGGRTGRDGIHGATFSSLQLDKDTPLSPVQIGNPIVEKKVADTVLQARDLGLYSAITDCGAGGFSSAIGELGKDCGARVYLERAPLKYAGLMPWEIWVSEAQERMVLAVPVKNVKKMLELFSAEDVEATVLGDFTGTGRLEVLFRGRKICDLEMEFLHEGLPRLLRKAYWEASKNEEPVAGVLRKVNLRDALRKILASPNVCSKEWVVRQYDHEVQGQTVVKPFSGARNEGPSDACVIYPYTQMDQTKKTVYRAVAVSNGINPNYGKIDPYWMAASAIDEGLRNVACVGGDLSRTALLDNFCWGNCNKPDQLAGIVRASQACYDIAKIYGVPFVSGKDSLNNEFKDEKGRTLSVLSTLLISVMSIVPDIRKIVTMDFKKPGNLVYVLGETKDELGGSHYFNLYKYLGNNVPRVDPVTGKRLMVALGRAISKGLLSACHDCSEGGIGVALAEMAFSGGYGAEIMLEKAPRNFSVSSADINAAILFSESNSRFVVEVAPEKEKEFKELFKNEKTGRLGKVTEKDSLVIRGIKGNIVLEDNTGELENSWRSTLKNI